MECHLLLLVGIESAGKSWSQEASWKDGLRKFLGGERVRSIESRSKTASGEGHGEFMDAAFAGALIRDTPDCIARFP